MRQRVLESIALILVGFCLEWSVDLTSKFGNVLSSHPPDSLQIKSKSKSKSKSKHQNQQDQEQPKKNVGIVSQLHTYNSKVQFVFVVGLEGVGHHLMGSIIQGSPALRQLTRLGIHPSQTSALQKLLFNQDTNMGLWNAHCNLNENQAVNTSQIQAMVAGVLQKIEQLAEPSRETKLVFPVNTLRIKEVYTLVGESSYPNFGQDACRSLRYPSLDLFYDTCNLAQVDCRHVYLYRNPYDVLYSTTIGRNFNPTLLNGIHLYKSMLHIIATELQTHASRTIGCFGFYEDDLEEWWDPMRSLWGWRNRTNYNEFMKRTYKAPTHKNTVDRKSLVSKDFDPYMKSLLQIHERVIQICRESTRSTRTEQR